MGVIPVIWLSLIIAPSFSSGLPTIIKDFPNKMGNPFFIKWCDDSLKVIFILLLFYGIGIYLSSKRNYRKRDEHGSAKWSEAKRVNKIYEQQPFLSNKLLTQNISIGYNAKNIEET